ncbi:uncharacterized protein DDB_G0284459-like [Ipomoea triloba]|uniref:uncharacterized protein DDB_G0284459-like n=1 Tax=Ipomoea triloba TaxID=35885 RepID=UPI00125D32CF|nr:uncharacterized protein DDB_G0284459-like [Ipomoea triloba]
MATRVRESGLRGKEKKGSQADNTMPQQHKRITATTTTTTSRLMSSSSSSIASSVPNYLRPTTASSAVQAAGDKPSSARRKSLDRPLSHLDTHRNLAGDKPSPARRKSLDRPIQPLHSPLSSPSSSCSSTSSLPYKPTFSRTKSSLDRPKSSTAMSRTSEANDKRGKIMTRSISSVSKSSSIAHNHHLKTTPNKTQKSSTRKQPGNTTLSSKPIKKKPVETILTTNHPHEPSVPIPQSADHHKTEASATPNSNQTEINNNNNSKIVQEKENIIVVVSSDHEEFEDLKSIEDCSSLSSVLEDPPIDPVDTITEEGDAEAISVPENLQECGQTQSADTMPHTTPEDPKVEDKAGGEINNLKETTPADPKPADEISVEEKGDETIHSSDNNCSENKAENQEEGEEEEREKEKEKDKKADNQHHHQEVAEEEVKEMTDDQSNNNNNNNNNNVGQVPEANKPALKRNESVVSNDVIEETASKLREQRKNKVKALAGAFETVISLQDK